MPDDWNTCPPAVPARIGPRLPWRQATWHVTVSLVSGGHCADGGGRVQLVPPLDRLATNHADWRRPSEPCRAGVLLGADRSSACCRHQTGGDAVPLGSAASARPGDNRGWLDDRIPGWFADYAAACFDAFGDRVTTWITFNEPITFVNLGYGAGTHAPGRCTNRGRCRHGNSTSEPYLAGHNVILAHALAVQRFRRTFNQADRTGHEVGITLNANWGTPYDPASRADVAAAERSMIWQLAWWADPIFLPAGSNDYPADMRTHCGQLLLELIDEQRSLLAGSADFYGMNQYTTKYIRDRPDAASGMRPYQSSPTGLDGTVIGPTAQSRWLNVVPWGLRANLNWVSQRYSNGGDGQPTAQSDKLKIYITENGCDVPGRERDRAAGGAAG